MHPLQGPKALALACPQDLAPTQPLAWAPLALQHLTPLVLPLVPMVLRPPPTLSQQRQPLVTPLQGLQQQREGLGPHQGRPMVCPREQQLLGLGCHQQACLMAHPLGHQGRPLMVHPRACPMGLPLAQLPEATLMGHLQEQQQQQGARTGRRRGRTRVCRHRCRLEQLWEGHQEVRRCWGVWGRGMCKGC